MPNYRRSKEGSHFFFTVVTDGRIPILLSTTARSALRQAIRETQTRWPFEVEAMVLLDDHLHTIWVLPQGDVDYPKRLGFIKKSFSQIYLAAGGQERSIRPSKQLKRERGVWQRRYWEHTLWDEDDHRKHMDYIHYNPVKHGLVECPGQYPYSSFHRLVKAGVYEADWGCLGARVFESWP